MVASNYPDETLRPPEAGDAITELPLLLPAWQVEALEQLARADGITVGQLLRRVVNRTVAHVTLEPPDYYHG